VEQTALEKADAVIAVSKGTRDDILNVAPVKPDRVHVIYNGIDTSLYRAVPETDALERYGVDASRPYVLFVGRITRQKGIVHLARAIPSIDSETQVVLCAGQPDTPEIAEEMEQAVEVARREHDAVIWVQKMLPRQDAIQMYSHATLFCCPSIYEPFGIINLEAMACGTAVITSNAPALVEITGDAALHVDAHDANALAGAMIRIVNDDALRGELASRGIARARQFTWRACAETTREAYERALDRR
jgi:glycosyltransferase involved in cell wall biosynthesis